MHAFVIPDILPEACVQEFKASQDQKAEKADFFCKGLRNQAVNQGTEQKRQTQAETAYPVDGGNLQPGEGNLIKPVGRAGHKGVQAQGGYEEKKV